MKPLNIDNQGCNPVSSNCVIWQGPDIPCITLCKGDSISDVTFKLATELCEVLDQLNISTLDLDCFSPNNCGPADFHALLQLIITKVCSLENTTTETRSPINCPDCIVPIAPCFYYTNGTGDTVTTMQLVDYIQAIGNKICGLVNQITIINQTLQNYGIRITALENEPDPVFVLPSFVPACVITTTTPISIDIILQALETAFCNLQGATGTPSQILTGISAQCPDLNNQPQLSGAGVMGTIPGWNNTVFNLSQSITNLWLTICDLRATVNNIKLTCCNEGCQDIQVTMSSYLSATTLHITFNGVIPLGFLECAPGVTTFTISDQSGNFIVRTGNVIGNLNTPGGLSYDTTGLNILDNLTITATLCLTDVSLGQTCQYYLNHILNSTNCPTIVYTPGYININYAGTVPAGSATYDVKLYDALGITLLQTNSIFLVGPAPITGSFTGLTSGTSYRVLVTVTTTTSTYDCPWVLLATPLAPCTPPTAVSGLITFNP
jgi:hypothetical protein